MCSLQTPLHSPAQVPLNNSKDPPQTACAEQGTSSDENEMSDKNRRPCTSPSRRDSYSDSSGSGEDDLAKAPAKIPNMSWSSALQQTLSNMMSQAQSHHDTLRSQEDPICTMFYYPQKVPNKPEHEGRYCQYWASLVAQLQCRRHWFNSWVGKILWKRVRLPTPVFLGFPGGSISKESACNAGDLGLIPGLGRSPREGHGNPLQYSCLENPHGQRSLAGYSHGVAESRTQLSNFHFLSLCVYSGPTVFVQVFYCLFFFSMM